MATDTDRLMHRVADGDQAAFAELYDALAAAVFGTVVRVLRDRQQAEEVAQEVFMNTWSAAPTWDENRGSAMTFVLTIARRRAIDRVRSEVARKRRESKTVVDISAPDIAHETAELKEASEHMRICLQELPGEQRDVITRAFYAGQTHRQIADELELPLGTVKSRMTVGLQKLRRRLEAHV